jgi:hypothetical protein
MATVPVPAGTRLMLSLLTGGNNVVACQLDAVSPIRWVQTFVYSSAKLLLIFWPATTERIARAVIGHYTYVDRFSGHNLSVFSGDYSP